MRYFILLPILAVLADPAQAQNMGNTWGSNLNQMGQQQQMLQPMQPMRPLIQPSMPRNQARSHCQQTTRMVWRNNRFMRVPAYQNCMQTFGH